MSQEQLDVLERLALLPIEHVAWVGDVPPIDTTEPLTEVRPSQGLAISPAYAHLRPEATGGRLLVRHSVLVRLERAARSLPAGFALLVLDAWRSEGLQRSLFERMKATAARSGVDPRRYVFDPDLRDASVSYPIEDAPHRTGGAVDVVLLAPNRVPLPLGASFDEASENSATAALEGSATAAPHTRAQQLGRRLLFWTMVAAGFTNYPAEFWHYDFGNAFWRHFGLMPAGTVYRTIDS